VTLQWISVDALTGRVLLDVPSLVPAWPLRRSIGSVETATAALYLKDLPKDWQRATLPMASVLATFDDADDARTIQWAGLVVRRQRVAGTGRADLTLNTGEHYFDRRSISVDSSYAAVGQNTIIRSLVTQFIADAGGMPFVVQATGAGALRDASYMGKDFSKVLQRMQELMALPGGPEWTVEWAWAPDGEHLVPTLVLADRLGASPPPGVGPAASFDMPGGCLVGLQVVEDYGDGRGATRVTTYSSGQGGSTPTSGPVDGVNAAGRPTVEFVTQPAASIVDQDTLVGYAQKQAALLAPGQTAVALTASLEDAPRLGAAWRLGDDVQYNVEPMLEFPDGLNGVGRAIAYEVTLDTISPILAQQSI
jgi:hypothetical protein